MTLNGRFNLSNISEARLFTVGKYITKGMEFFGLAPFCLRIFPRGYSVVTRRKREILLVHLVSVFLLYYKRIVGEKYFRLNSFLF